jgi:hypothetical protein
MGALHLTVYIQTVFSDVQERIVSVELKKQNACYVHPKLTGKSIITELKISLHSLSLIYLLK